MTIQPAGFRPSILVLVAAALFGSATPVAKALLESLGPFPLAGFLYLGAAAAVWPVVMRDGLPGRRLLSRNALRLSGILLFGGIGYALDSWLATSHWFLLGGLFLGIIVGFYGLAKTVWH